MLGRSLFSFGTFDSSIPVFDSHSHDMFNIQQHYSIDFVHCAISKPRKTFKIFGVKILMLPPVLVTSSSSLSMMPVTLQQYF